VSAALRITLRLAVAGDAEALWRWRNDPVTRRASFDEREVPLEAHARWFEEALGRADRRIYIVEADGAAAGMVRLDLAGGEGAVSINLAAEWRGRGIGAEALRLLAREAFGRLRLARVTALVKADNPGSRAAFERAGFSVSRDGDPVVLARASDAGVSA
jgi:RimJ/RimL family protein N-acetyltransferase